MKCCASFFFEGIVAIFYAIRAVRAHSQGFYAEATTFDKKATRWSLITFIVGLVLGSAIGFLFFVKAVLFIWRSEIDLLIFFCMWSSSSINFFVVVLVVYGFLLSIIYMEMKLFFKFEGRWALFDSRSKMAHFNQQRNIQISTGKMVAVAWAYLHFLRLNGERERERCAIDYVNKKSKGRISRWTIALVIENLR